MSLYPCKKCMVSWPTSPPRYSKLSANSGHNSSAPTSLPSVCSVGLFRMKPALAESSCSNKKMTACTVYSAFRVSHQEALAGQSACQEMLCKKCGHSSIVKCKPDALRSRSSCVQGSLICSKGRACPEVCRSSKILIESCTKHDLYPRAHGTVCSVQSDSL